MTMESSFTFLTSRATRLNCGNLSTNRTSAMDNTRVYRMTFASVYPHYIQKAEKKGRTKAELDEIIFWLTGYNKKTLQQHIDKKSDFETFFAEAPQLNPNVS